MAFKLTKDFKWCITNIISNNFKDKIKGRVWSLISTSSSMFKGLPYKENVDFFSGFFASFLLIFRFFFISDWSRFPSFLLKTQSLSPLLQFYFKYSVDFYVFSFFLSFLFICLQGPSFQCDFFSFYSLKRTGGCETICGFECDFPKLDHTWFFPLIC